MWVRSYLHILYIIALASQNDTVRPLGKAENFVPIVHSGSLEVESGPEPRSPGSFCPYTSVTMGPFYFSHIS